MTIDMTKEDLDQIHAVTAEIGTIFTWDYERSRVPLMKLYEKAKTSQWNGSTDLDWSIDVDPERTADELSRNDRRMQYVRSIVATPNGRPPRQRIASRGRISVTVTGKGLVRIIVA